MAERTMFADKSGRELMLGDTVRAAVDDAFREFGVHGEWAEYEITKAPGGYALSYLRSEKGAVLPFGYLCCFMADFNGNELPDIKNLMFAREPIQHPALEWVDDRTDTEQRANAFRREAEQRIRSKLER